MKIVSSNVLDSCDDTAVIRELRIPTLRTLSTIYIFRNVEPTYLQKDILQLVPFIRLWTG
jgi:hypothetical protein